MRAFPLVILVAGCAARPVAPTPAAPPLAMESAAPAVEPSPLAIAEPVATATPAPLGGFQFTYYLVADEAEHRGKKNTTIYGERCKPLAKVAKSFAKDLAMEGTGKLRDGRLLNWVGRCAKGQPKYRVLDASAPWGLGVGDRRLAPFRSIATDPKVIATGAKVYVAELDGVTMPLVAPGVTTPGTEPWGGFVHDGCVEAVDIGGRINQQHIDFFTGTRAAYRSLDRQLALTHVTLYDGAGRCN